MPNGTSSAACISCRFHSASRWDGRQASVRLRCWLWCWLRCWLWCWLRCWLRCWRAVAVLRVSGAVRDAMLRRVRSGMRCCAGCGLGCGAGCGAGCDAGVRLRCWLSGAVRDAMLRRVRSGMRCCAGCGLGCGAGCGAGCDAGRAVAVPSSGGDVKTPMPDEPLFVKNVQN